MWQDFSYPILALCRTVSDLAYSLIGKAEGDINVNEGRVPIANDGNHYLYMGMASSFGLTPNFFEKLIMVNPISSSVLGSYLANIPSSISSPTASVGSP